jgi:hypothetical protein
MPATYAPGGLWSRPTAALFPHAPPSQGAVRPDRLAREAVPKSDRPQPANRFSAADGVQAASPTTGPERRLRTTTVPESRLTGRCSTWVSILAGPRGNDRGTPASRSPVAEQHLPESAQIKEALGRDRSDERPLLWRQTRIKSKAA